MKTRSALGAVMSVILLGLMAAPAMAQDIAPPRDLVEAPKAEYSPYIDDHFPTRVFFGDTHLHTSWSTDAGMAGASVGPDDAYRVARGEAITSFSGLKVKLIRPLDFIVIADHAENLGLADFIRRSDPIILANEIGKRWHDMNKAGNGMDAFLEWLRSDKEDLIKEPRMMQAVWAKVVVNADKYYLPGVFTTFHAFEWTSMPDGNNIHRVVIFRDGGDKTSQILPYSMYDSVDPEDLWDYLAGYEEKTGGQVLAIPHNGNLSNGLMFDVETYTGGPLTRAYAEMRSRYEPLYEVTQMKGDGESHPLLSPDDEFADFENLDAGNISGKAAKTEDMLPREYARPALKEGLRLEQKLGVNPFKFGMIGSTDAHTGLPTSREENNFSKAHIAEPSADRAEHVLIQGAQPELSVMVEDLGASGLAAVWARENTRESIWDAMARKEVYATTGPRMMVRFFGGWDYTDTDIASRNPAFAGYEKGVPMGGDLLPRTGDGASTFMVYALKDPINGNLDRIQIIKGWLDDRGDTQEKVYDVAWSDGRVPGADGKLPPVGNTVDARTANFTNTIGASELAVVWTDPDFDPEPLAFYYARVIEIPTPRWSTYEAFRFGIPIPEGAPVSTQERAYTSPIWYTP